MEVDKAQTDMEKTAKTASGDSSLCAYRWCVLAGQTGRVAANPVFAGPPSPCQPWTSAVLATVPLYATFAGSAEEVLTSTARVSWSTLSSKLRCGYGDYVYDSKALNELRNVWPATRTLDNAPVVVKHIMSKANGPIFQPISMQELWGSLVAHQHLPHAIPVLDVFIDTCRYPRGFDKLDTPALVFPRLLPLVVGPGTHARPATLLPWRAVLAVGVALYEHLVGLQRIACTHLDIKPNNIVVATDDWTRITPSDVYVIDYEMLIPFGFDIPEVAGTKGFRHSDFYDLEQGETDYVTTGARLDVCSVGWTLRELMVPSGCEKSVLDSKPLMDMVEKAMYTISFDDRVPSMMKEMAQTLDRLCCKHQLPFRLAPSCDHDVPTAAAS